jgi:CHAT domain-containing protein
MGKDLQNDKTQVAGSGLQRICLLCLIFLMFQPAIIEALIPMNPPAEDLSLVAGKSIERELSAGETHSYVFELPQQSFLRISFYSPNTDLLVSIVWPGGRKSLKWDILRRATAPISFVVDIAGTYQIRVQSAEKNESSGSYLMEINNVGSSGAQEQMQVAACRRLSTAAQLRRQWTEASLKSAIREYEEALKLWKAAGDRSQEAAALKNAGNIWETLGEWQTALSCYERAQAVYAQLNDLMGETAVINAVSALYINRGEYQKALDIYTPKNRATEDPRLKAHRLRNFGAAYWGMGEMDKATDFLNHALELWELIRDPIGQADVLLHLGYVNHSEKDVSAAKQYYQLSLDLSREAENPHGIAEALAALGHVSNISGERQEALEYYHQSLKIFEDVGDLSGRYVVLEGIAYMYAGLGENNRAVDYYVRALDLARRTKDLACEGEILAYLSIAYRELGDYENALQYSQAAIDVYKSIASTLGESYALANRCMILEALGKQKESDECYIQALGLSRKVGDRFLQGLLLNALGHLYHGSDQPQKALDYYKQALSLQEKSNDSVRMPSTLHNLARAERDAGDLELALQYSEKGLEIAESLRGKVASPELRGSYLASIHQQYEFMIDLLMHLQKRHPHEQFAAKALKISEQSRARSLLDSLIEAKADIRGGVDLDLLKQEQSLQKELDAKAELQMQILKGKYSKEREKALAAEINAVTAEYQNVQALIRSTSPHYAALTQPQPLSLQEIQQLVDEKTLLLEYALGEECSYFWAVTPTTLHGYELPKRIEIETLAQRVRELMLERQRNVEETGAQFRQRIQKADKEYWKEAAALSRILLGPISNQLASKRILIVTEGALQYLPFAALPEPNLAGNDAAMNSPTLIEGHEIVNLPSASVLGVLRQETGRRSLPPKLVAVLADPVFENEDPRIKANDISMKHPDTPLLASGPVGLSALQRNIRGIGSSSEGFAIHRLPATRDEANAIMALIPEGSGLELFGFNANRKTVSGPELGQYRIVHFATHGFLNDEHPELSGLVLSLFDRQGIPQDGFLRLHDIYSLKLPVELVVLSACNSGLGKEVRGEGLVGIVRGFMYAGAERLLASLWKVDDEATAALMKRFYQHMLQQGETPATALRKAQLEMSSQKRWQAPYYWAAFILQGEWK